MIELLQLAFALWFMALVGSGALYLVWKIIEYIAFGGPAKRGPHVPHI